MIPLRRISVFLSWGKKNRRYLATGWLCHNLFGSGKRWMWKAQAKQLLRNKLGCLENMPCFQHVSDVQHGRFLYPKLAEQKTCHVFTDGRNFCIRLVLLVYPIIYIGVFTLTASPFVALQIRAKPFNTFQKIKDVGKNFWGFRPKKSQIFWHYLLTSKKSTPHTKITRKSFKTNITSTSPTPKIFTKFCRKVLAKGQWLDWLVKDRKRGSSMWGCAALTASRCPAEKTFLSDFGSRKHLNSSL